MNKGELIRNLKDRIDYNEQEVAKNVQKHGEYVRENPSVTSSHYSEMSDWHRGKIAAFELAIQMVAELEVA